MSKYIYPVNQICKAKVNERSPYFAWCRATMCFFFSMASQARDNVGSCDKYLSTARIPQIPMSCPTYVHCPLLEPSRKGKYLFQALPFIKIKHSKYIQISVRRYLYGAERSVRRAFTRPTVSLIMIGIWKRWVLFFYTHWRLLTIHLQFVIGIHWNGSYAMRVRQHSFRPDRSTLYISRISCNLRGFRLTV